MPRVGQDVLRHLPRCLPSTDTTTGELFIGRDRLGINVLDTSTFPSSPSQADQVAHMVIPASRSRSTPRRWLRFLKFGSTTKDEQTFFAGVKRLMLRALDDDLP